MDFYYGIRESYLDKIAYRDRYICHLCVEPVNMTLEFPNLMCAVLDHLIPKSMGGRPIPSNLVLSHNICNSWRGTLDYIVARELRIGWKLGDTHACNY